MNTRMFFVVMIFVGVLWAIIIGTGHASTKTCTTAPVTTSVVARGGQRVEVNWKGVCGTVAKIKRDDYRVDPYGNRFFFVPNTGSVVLTNQPTGKHSYRTCDISGVTSICSLPVVGAVQ